MADCPIPLWSVFMRFVAALFLILGSTVSALAQQDSQQLASQVDKLTALLEQQQKQIEQLQKSQSDLLQELHAQRAPAIPPSAAPTSSGATSVSESAVAQSSTYDAPKERGIALGDRVRIDGYGS